MACEEILKDFITKVNDNFFNSLKKKYELSPYTFTLLMFQDKLGFSKSTLNVYLHKTKVPTLPNAIKLAKILKFPLKIDLELY